MSNQYYNEGDRYTGDYGTFEITDINHWTERVRITDARASEEMSIAEMEQFIQDFNYHKAPKNTR